MQQQKDDDTTTTAAAAAVRPFILLTQQPGGYQLSGTLLLNAWAREWRVFVTTVRPFPCEFTEL